MCEEYFNDLQAKRKEERIKRNEEQRNEERENGTQSICKTHNSS
jgi:hypothetical protein